MTSDMAFECLLVSQDPTIFSIVGGILRNLSISMDCCLSSSRASRVLPASKADLLVIDWEGHASSELLHEIWKSGRWQKPTIVAISESTCPIPGAHVLLRKPVTAESGTKSLKAAYSRMLQDHRRHARYDLMISIMATDESKRTVPVTIVNVGDGGLGLATKANLGVGDVLSFRLFLPGAKRDIYIQARILWRLDNGRAGCEFLRIPPVDLSLLFEWLKGKIRIKRPLIDV